MVCIVLFYVVFGSIKLQTRLEERIHDYPPEKTRKRLPLHQPNRFDCSDSSQYFQYPGKLVVERRKKKVVSTTANRSID